MKNPTKTYTALRRAIKGYYAYYPDAKGPCFAEDYPVLDAEERELLAELKEWHLAVHQHRFRKKLSDTFGS